MNEKSSNKDKKEKMPEELKQRMAVLPRNVQETVFVAVQEYSSIIEKETYLLVLRIMKAKD